MWLRERRKQLNINQNDLARRLQLLGIEITPGSISHWENGRNKPPLDEPQFRSALAESLNLAVADMLILAGYEMPDDSVSITTARAISIMERLPKPMQVLAIEYLEMLEQHTARINNHHPPAISSK